MCYAMFMSLYRCIAIDSRICFPFFLPSFSFDYFLIIPSKYIIYYNCVDGRFVLNSVGIYVEKNRKLAENKSYLVSHTCTTPPSGSIKHSGSWDKSQWQPSSSEIL
jgi:hypothetical protein